MNKNKKILIGYIPKNISIKFRKNINLGGDVVNNSVMIHSKYTFFFTKYNIDCFDSYGYVCETKKIKITIEEI